MTIHLERKKVKNADKFPYQRLSYDIADANNSISIFELSKVLDEFTNRSDGEFAYAITDRGVVDEHGNITFGKPLFGKDLFNHSNEQSLTK